MYVLRASSRGVAVAAAAIAAAAALLALAGCVAADTQPQSLRGGIAPAVAAPLVCDVTAAPYHAVCDGKTDDSKAFAAAVQACIAHAARVGYLPAARQDDARGTSAPGVAAVVHVPQGATCLTGRAGVNFTGATNVAFQVDGTVLAPPSISSWDDGARQFVNFAQCTNVTLRGAGTIDGQGAAWWKVRKVTPTHFAPLLVHTYSSSHILVTGVTLQNSPKFHLPFSACTDVEVAGVQIYAPRDSPNTDGIDLGGVSGAHVHDCRIINGDDGCAVGSGSSNILVERVYHENGHGASIGSIGENNSTGYVSNVTFRDITFNRTENGARIKTWQGGHGAVKNITYFNFTMVDVTNALLVTQYYCPHSQHPKDCVNYTAAVAISDITFDTISGTHSDASAGSFLCSDSTPCQGLTMTNVHMEPSQSGGHNTFSCWKAHGIASNDSPPPCFTPAPVLAAASRAAAAATSTPASASALALAPQALQAVPLGVSKPKGWVEQQLRAQLAGLSGRQWLGAGGHVNDSNWVGGHGYNGLAESMPYWANGAVPMAVLLDDADTMQSLQELLTFIFDQQNSSKNNGWLGPLVDGSEWSTFRMATSMAQWSDATGDHRVRDSLVTFSSVLLAHLRSTPIANGTWTQMRWQEMVSAYQWLIDTHASSLSDAQLATIMQLMSELRAQGFDWTTWVASNASNPFFTPPAPVPPGPYTEHMDSYGDDLQHMFMPASSTHLDCEAKCNATQGCEGYVWGPSGCGGLTQNNCWLKAMMHPFIPNQCRNTRALGSSAATVKPWFPDNTQDADAIGTNKWLGDGVNRLWVHGVNLGQAMDTWGSMYRITGDASWLSQAKAMWNKVYRLHGQATGVFTGDETLAGLMPERGTETCTVVEIMNSAGRMFEITGDTYYADILETVAFNALPAAFFNGTMWSLNYFQQVNKLDAMDGEPKCESGATYAFGMVYECCVSNHGQGWPKWSARQFALVPAGSSAAHDAAGPGLAITQYFDSEATDIQLPNGNAANVSVRTDYPFGSGAVNVSVTAKQAFAMYVRIPAWCSSATVVVHTTALGAEAARETAVQALGPFPAGTLQPVPLPAGSSSFTLQLPLEVRVERRPAYRPTPDTTVAARAMSVYRGPVLYALPRGYTQDVKGVFDNGPGLLPAGQSHGQNNYLLGTANWTHALYVANDADPGADLVYSALAAVPAPPPGQGIFAEALAPGIITAKAALLGEGAWPPVETGRGAEVRCDSGTTSIPGYVTKWAGIPPTSPVQAPSTPPTTVTLVPFGATNIRVAEFPTIQASAP